MKEITKEEERPLYKAGKLELLAGIRFKFGQEHAAAILADSPKLCYVLDDSHGATIYRRVLDEHSNEVELNWKEQKLVSDMIAEAI